jgi:hypothetical protein
MIDKRNPRKSLFPNHFFFSFKDNQNFILKNFRWNMSSKYVNPNNNNISFDNTINNNQNPNQKSAPCAVANHLSSSHHVRHHSYDTTSNKLAAQIFPSSRSNRKETDTNENHHSRFLPPRSSHRHTSSYAANQSSFINLNSNHYHQHNYSASQENLRRKSFKC